MKALLVTIGLLSGTTLVAQSAFTLKYFGLTIHPFGDNTASLQPYKLDKNSHFVLNFGLFAGYEKFVYEDFISVKIIQGGFTDCSGGMAGFTHLGIRGVVYENRKNRFSIGIGPTLLYRDSWSRFGEAYTPSGFFNETTFRRLGAVQWKFFPVGAEIEYDRKIREKDELSFSFTPGVPMACIFSVGWKHWISKEFRQHVKLVVPR